MTDTGEDLPSDAGDPIEGQILLVTAAKASVSPSILPDLVDRVQSHLAADRDAYRRQFECVHEDDERSCFLVARDHWATLGPALGLTEREWDAVRRAHNEQLRRVGRRTDRRGEFETALEIRDAVVVGR